MRGWNIFHDLKPIEKQTHGLIGPEWITLAYGLFTSVLILIFWNRLEYPVSMVLARVSVLIASTISILIYRTFPCRAAILLRIVLQMGLLAFWYPETYEFNRLLPNMDHVFASIEEAIFSCQPAIEFSRMLSGKIFSEAFNLGYWLYFPMIVLVILYHYWMKPEKCLRVTSIVLMSFFLYYIIYIFLPVAGPQYYYLAIGYPDNDIYEIAKSGFPSIGDYFSTHMKMLAAPGDPDGFFFKRVAEAQAAGERPTAAFPSSHVGISTILLIISWKSEKRMFYALLPVYVLLCCATVYIQAHYLIDAICGFISSFAVYWAASRISSCSFLKTYNSDLPK